MKLVIERTENMGIMDEEDARESNALYHGDIARILADPESLSALQVLEAKGWCSSRIHGAYSAVVRQTRGRPKIPDPLDMSNDDGTPI